MLRNTLYLYLRMVVNLLLALITSRLVLEALGVDDFGVYNLVGGVVGFFSFIKNSMVGAASRFITYELGLRERGDLKGVFNSALAIHGGIALLLILLCETVGLWLLNHRLVIPEVTMPAARIVFQISIFTAALSVTQVPYNAVLIAEERMSAFAFIGIAESCCRLGAVLALPLFGSSRLVPYAAALALIAAASMAIYRIYCIRRFAYTRLAVGQIRWRTIRPMLTFSGWDLYGNLSVSARTEGVGMLANIFFGTVVNAAIGIANQVQAALNGFASNITIALKPRIIKSYAAGDYPLMRQLLYRGCKFTFLVLMFLSLPLLLEMPFVLRIWLGEVPAYTAWISRLALLFILFSNMSFVLVSGVHAIGCIKLPSFINGTLYLLVIPLAYVAYRLGGSVYWPFVLNLAFVFCGMLANLFYVAHYVKEISVPDFLLRVVGKNLLLLGLSALLPLAVRSLLPLEGWGQFLTVTATSLLASAIVIYRLGLTPAELKCLFR